MAGDKTCGELNSNPRRIFVLSLVGVMITGVLILVFVNVSRSLDPIPKEVRL